MEFTLTTAPVAELRAGALVVICFASGKDGEAGPMEVAAAGLDKATRQWIAELEAAQEFTGKALETATLHRPTGLNAARLVLAGAGERAKFDTIAARRLGGAVLRELKGAGVREIAIRLENELATGATLGALAEGATLGDYEPDLHKSDPHKNDKRVERLAFSVSAQDAALDAAMKTARIVAEAQNYTRALANEPSNLLPPRVLVERARAMAAEFGLDCEVLDEARMKQLGFGSLLGVAQGSIEPPFLLIVRYTPESAATTDHLALVGKGVTFDSGGISLKPSEGMDKMRYDMAGAATVLGALRAIAQLKPPIAVTAFAPCVENMPGGRAQRPGDIVTAYNGKTIEVLNTDAEGRLILADALSYAARQGCTHLVDAATLTGAIAVALGAVYAGVFSNNEALQTKVVAAGRRSGERLWPFPMDDEYSDLLKSAFADLPNIGTRYGGSITAAKFLENFVEDRPWVHLDIAGTAYLDEAKPHLAKGPTGLAVRTMIQLALDWTA
jgi:leucyl aminopeptidase